jgi:hypothetical protein
MLKGIDDGIQLKNVYYFGDSIKIIDKNW